MNKLKLILSTVAEYYECDLDAVKSRSRPGDLVRVRQMYSVLAKDLLDGEYSLAKIGEEIDRTHSNVLQGNKAMSNDLETNPEIRSSYKHLRAVLEWELKGTSLTGLLEQLSSISDQTEGLQRKLTVVSEKIKALEDCNIE